MKAAIIPVIAILAGSGVVLATDSKGQEALNKKISLKVSDQEMLILLNKLEEVADISFIYSPEVIPVHAKVSLDANNEPLKKVLKELLDPYNILFEAVKNQIVLRKQDTSVPRSPARIITGQVTNEENFPLPGVSILIKGTGIGTTTDAEGRYSLTVPTEHEQGTLVISFIGYATQEIAMGDRTSIDIQMTPEVQALQEVVVIGYGTVAKSDLTGSVASVDIDQTKTGSVTSLGTVLQGRATGVQVTQNTGRPGGGFTIRIRGGNSMQGGNDPLYVIDGFPVSDANILNVISVDDIESIDILKDASSTAIYGARGANGVVMITTKKGRKGGKIEFDGSISMQQPARTIPLMNSRQYAKMVNDWAQQQGLSIPYADINNLPYDTDWQDEIFQSAPIHNYSLSFSGGNDKTRYSVSGNYLDQEGIIVSSDFKRGSLRANLDSEINSRVRVTNQFLFASTGTNEVPTSILEHAFIAPPTIPVYDDNGNYYDYSLLPWWGAYPRNPVADANETTNQQNSLRIMESFSAEYKVIEGLTVKTFWGIDFSNSVRDVYYTRRHESGGTGGRAENHWGRDVVFLNENTANYTVDLADHRINATAGYTWQHGQERRTSLVGRGFINDLLKQDVVGSANELTPPSTPRSSWTLISWLGRINYAYADRYLFTSTLRADGSSRFGSGNKYGFFPSLAVGWRLLNESFMSQLKANDLLSEIKLRFSWGVTGNQEIGTYNSLQRINPIFYNDAGQLKTAYAPVSIANPDLSWEETEQIDVGVDLAFWDERFTLSIDGYVKNTTGLLAMVNLPPSSGFSTMLRNIGAIRNSGFEVGIGVVPIQTDQLFWKIDANISVNKNEVVKLAGGNSFLAPGMGNLGPIHIVSEGEPLGVFYGFKQAGLNEQGGYRYVDMNNDNVITDADRVVLGSPYPDFNYGINSSLTYKGFDLSFTLQGIHGNKIYNYANGFSAASLAKGYNQIADVSDNYWTADNRYPNPKYPKLSTAGYDLPSERFIEDGSYLRLSSLRLGYRFDLSGNDLMVYLSGRNLFTVTNYSGYDPEVNMWGSGDLRAGVDYYTYPQARVFTIGLRLTL